MTAQVDERSSDALFKIETHGIDAIPDAERHGRPRELGFLWAGAFVNYASLFTASLLTTYYGLGVWDGLIATALGTLAAAVILGLLSNTGPRTGLPQIVYTRRIFGLRGSYLGAALTLLTLSAVVLASAWYRLDLYQQAYGWTELRFYANAAIAFLALALAIFAWCVLRERMAYALQPLAMAVVLVALSANAIGPSAFVARADIARILDPSGLPPDAARTLDADHLVNLGGGAIAELVGAFPRLPTSQRLYADILLRIELSRRDEDRAPDWQGWNFERERERLALIRARDELLR